MLPSGRATVFATPHTRPSFVCVSIPQGFGGKTRQKNSFPENKSHKSESCWIATVPAGDSPCLIRTPARVRSSRRIEGPPLVPKHHESSRFLPPSPSRLAQTRHSFSTAASCRVLVSPNVPACRNTHLPLFFAPSRVAVRRDRGSASSRLRSGSCAAAKPSTSSSVSGVLHKVAPPPRLLLSAKDRPTWTGAFLHLFLLVFTILRAVESSSDGNPIF